MSNEEYYGLPALSRGCTTRPPPAAGLEPDRSCAARRGIRSHSNQPPSTGQSKLSHEFRPQHIARRSTVQSHQKPATLAKKGVVVMHVATLDCVSSGRRSCPMEDPPRVSRLKCSHGGCEGPSQSDGPRVIVEHLQVERLACVSPRLTDAVEQPPVQLVEHRLGLLEPRSTGQEVHHPKAAAGRAL